MFCGNHNNVNYHSDVGASYHLISVDEMKDELKELERIINCYKFDGLSIEQALLKIMLETNEIIAKRNMQYVQRNTK